MKANLQILNLTKATVILTALLPFTGCQSTSLHQSIQRGDAARATKLIQTGHNIDQPDQSGNTPLLYAIRKKNVELTQALVDKGASVNGSPNSKDFPLKAAVLAGSEPITEYLLKYGADVNRADARGITALHQASQTGNRQDIERLLNAGANVNVYSTNGTTPLMNAIANKKLTTNEFSLFLERGHDINFQLPGKNTALIVAAYSSRTDAADFLLQPPNPVFQRADLEKKGYLGRSALIAAAFNGHTNMCAFLIQAGAQLESTDTAGNTALGAALERGHFRCAAQLLAAGVPHTIATNSIEQRFNAGLYLTLLADKQSADGQKAEAQQNYSSALSHLKAARDEFSKTAQADTKKAARKDAAHSFWMAVLQGAAEGLAQGSANGLQQSQQYSSYRQNAQITALSHAKTMQQYQSGYSQMMKNYHPTPVSSPYMNLSPVSTEASAGAEDLRREASSLEERVKVCDQFISQIQQGLKQHASK